MASRIMVINDTVEILELFEEILSDEGHEVITHSFSDRTHLDIEGVTPDLLIMDYLFGREELGWQTLQKIKMRRETASIPVIVCTAAIKEVREIESHLRVKGVLLLPKPFEIDELLHYVRQALEIRENPAIFRGHADDNHNEDAAEESL
jgi:DNA-binding response OmpR family regulator